jgi:uncharacterized membrane protein YqjE
MEDPSQTPPAPSPAQTAWSHLLASLLRNVQTRLELLLLETGEAASKLLLIALLAALGLSALSLGYVAALSLAIWWLSSVTALSLPILAALVAAFHLVGGAALLGLALARARRLEGAYHGSRQILADDRTWLGKDIGT